MVAVGVGSMAFVNNTRTMDVKLHSLWFRSFLPVQLRVLPITPEPMTSTFGGMVSISYSSVIQPE